MTGLWNKIVLRKFLFLVRQIDGSNYVMYAYNFREVLREHSKHFPYEPKLIEPLDEIRGTNAILGSNSFEFDVGFQKKVYALSPIGAVEKFKTQTNLNDISVQQLHPVWLAE